MMVEAYELFCDLMSSGSNTVQPSFSQLCWTAKPMGWWSVFCNNLAAAYDSRWLRQPRRFGWSLLMFVVSTQTRRLTQRFKVNRALIGFCAFDGSIQATWPVDLHWQVFTCVVPPSQWTDNCSTIAMKQATLSDTTRWMSPVVYSNKSIYLSASRGTGWKDCCLRL